MESQPNLQDITDVQLAQKIMLIYSGSSTAEVHQAQQFLLHIPNNIQYVHRLINFLVSSTIPAQNFKISTSLLLKRILYNVAESDDDKSPFIRQLYNLLLMEGLPHKVKENLGVGLEYILNKDESDTYKSDLFSKVFEQQSKAENIDALFGFFTINIAEFNSIVDVEYSSQFFQKNLPIISKNAQILKNFIQKAVNQRNETTSPLMMSSVKTINKMVEFLELALQRICEEEEIIPYKVMKIRLNGNLISIIRDYLLLFQDEYSLISKSFQPINKAKQQIIQILFHLFVNFQLPQKIFEVLYSTFIDQAQHHFSTAHEYPIEKSNILCRILQLLDEQLKEKYYYQYFASYRIQALFALLSYSVTTKQELDEMNDNPTKFIQIAQQYSQAFSSSLMIKVRAACLLKTYTIVIDEFLKHVIQICTIVLSYNIAQKPQEIALVTELKERFNYFPFTKLNSVTQIQTVFMVLTVISAPISKREDLLNIVYALFITNLQKFQKIKNPLVIIRIIHVIGYYPTALYYEYIKRNIKINQTCKLQGLHTFQRFLQKNKYEQLYEIMGNIFIDLIDDLDVQDSFAQTLILNHYDVIVRKNEQLLGKVIILLKNSFIKYFQTNPHKAILTLNFINSLLIKQKVPQVRAVIQQQLVTNLIINIQDKKVEYQENIIEIYITLLEHSSIGETPEKILKFAQKNLGKIVDLGNNSKIFLFYNMLFFKINSMQLSLFYERLMALLFFQAQKTQTSIIMQLCYLLSQLIILNPIVELKPQTIQKLLRCIEFFQQEYRSSLLILFLSMLYVKPLQVKQILVDKKIYEPTLKFILLERYNGKFAIKMLVLALCQLWKIQENYQKDIVSVCVKYLFEQVRRNAIKIKQKEIINPKTRQFREFQQQEHREPEQYIPTGSPLDKFFSELKHPIKSKNENESFKQQIKKQESLLKQLSEQQRTKIIEIMQTDYVNDKFRKIYRVNKKQLAP